MGSAMSAGITGLEAHQRMFDVAGNNLSNINTAAFKGSRIIFSELLTQTIKKATQPTATVGGTNPQQIGTGVGIAGITPNMAQGGITRTGNPLDVAIEGAGYFVLNDGVQDIFTRAGAFAVDANSNLVDPTTGYIVQRTTSVGEDDGFQVGGDNNIRVPYEVSIPAKATSSITLTGNLNATGTSLESIQTNSMQANMAFTYSSGTAALTTTLIKDLDQYTGTLTAGTFTFSGFNNSGTSLATVVPAVDLIMDIDTTTTIADVLAWLNDDEGTAAVDEEQTIALDAAATDGSFTLTLDGETTASIDFDDSLAEIKAAMVLAFSNVTAANLTMSGANMQSTAGTTFTFDSSLGDVSDLSIDISGMTAPSTATVTEDATGRALQGVLGTWAEASLSDGKIVIEDTAAGYSQTDFAMTYSGSGTLTMPKYFEITQVGGEEVKNISTTIFDSKSGRHILSAAFVRTDTNNMWDMILTSISGDVDTLTFDNRRINGITFNASNGSYAGMDSTIGDTTQFVVTFSQDTANPQTMAMDLGTVGQFSGVTQFAKSSTAVAREQDGYEAGVLSDISVSTEGILIGAFTNGIKKNLAILQVALFQNPSGLESIGNGYLNTSVNSGDAVITQGLAGGAGTIHGGSLEKSNVDVAAVFVNMIEAQNGYHANARTIKIANEMLKELTNIIR